MQLETIAIVGAYWPRGMELPLLCVAPPFYFLAHTIISSTFFILNVLESTGAETWRGLGDGPPKFEVGTAHASVPPIF